jgi:hypothetical protein
MNYAGHLIKPNSLTAKYVFISELSSSTKINDLFSTVALPDPNCVQLADVEYVILSQSSLPE